MRQRGALYLTVFGASLLTALMCAACGRSDTKLATVAENATPMHAAWTKSAVMYEVNIRQYTPEGTFNAFARDLPRLKALGVDVLWIMPVQPIGKLNRKGSLGSYYSISNYREFNPEFGTKEDFLSMVNAAHELGMKVILDWVANHTAFDHAWTTEHKDYYTQKADGSISTVTDDKGKEVDWSDVADLNFDNRAMRAAMIGEMKWWLDNTPIDGFRCDVAGFVPYDFWREVSSTFRALRPDLFLLAEWEAPNLHASFDATYGWELYRILNAIAQHRASTSELTRYFARQQAAYGDSAYRLYFTSNHHENSWNGTEFERMGANHLPAYVLGATAKNSMPLLYTGQEASLQKRLRFFDKDTVNWNGPSLSKFYSMLFALKHAEPALWNGEWGGTQREITMKGSERTYAFVRTRDSSSVLVFLNFGNAPVTLSYSEVGLSGTYLDWFNQEQLTLREVGTVTLPAHGGRVLVRMRRSVSDTSVSK